MTSPRLVALGDYLRDRRLVRQPEEVGLARGANRKVGGLRRSEVAELAAISDEYYVRLEQGRGAHPSDGVLLSLADALGLDDESRAYLEDSLGILDLDSGEVTAFTSPGLWKLWHEWEQASKGKRQVVGNRVPAAESERQEVWAELLQARGEVEDDEEVAKTELQGERLGEIPRDAWYGRLVWRPSWLVGALEAAEVGAADGLARYLALPR